MEADGGSFPLWGTAMGSFWSGNWIEWPKASNALLGGEQEAKIRGKTKAKTTYARIIREKVDGEVHASISIKSSPTFHEYFFNF